MLYRRLPAAARSARFHRSARCFIALGLGGLMSGCSVLSVADAAVSVASTAVSVTATVVETTVDVAAAGVRAATADDKSGDEVKAKGDASVSPPSARRPGGESAAD